MIMEIESAAKRYGFALENIFFQLVKLLHI